MTQNNGQVIRQQFETKAELMDNFVQITTQKDFSDYDGEAERFINETVEIYKEIPQTIEPSLNETFTLLDKLQGQAGVATGGDVNKLVFSGLDVHEMLNEISDVLENDQVKFNELFDSFNILKRALEEINRSRHGMAFRLDRNPDIAKNALSKISRFNKEGNKSDE